MQITREHLMDVIESSINASGVCGEAADRLRVVARTHDKVARGCYELRGTGCPLVAAGIIREAHEMEDGFDGMIVADGIDGFYEDQITDFYATFDGKTMPNEPYNPLDLNTNILEVHN